jgi:hypothetical protein
MKILETVAAALDALGTPFALIGGRAVIARGYIRSTLDYDFLSVRAARRPTCCSRSVPRTGDLILLKLAAGGVIDVQDATILLRHGDRDRLIADVEQYLPDLDRDAHTAWERVKADSALPR